MAAEALVRMKSSPCACPTTPRAARWRRCCKTAACLAGALMLVEILRILVGANFHTVVPGLIYRGAQLSPAALARLVQSHGVRTVVNLRGNCWTTAWYDEQCRAVSNLGIHQEDICLSATRLPSAQELHELIAVFDRAERPLFIHCRRGADRTGLACTILLLLKTGVSLDEARGQLHWRFGHFALGKNGNLDAFFDLYQAWLQERRLEHSPQHFRRWIASDYPAHPMCCRFEQFTRLPATRLPHETVAENPLAFGVEVRNISARRWHIEPQRKAGIHVGFRVFDENGALHVEDRAALLKCTVEPGETLTAMLVLPVQLPPGTYRLLVDMVDEQQGWFYQVAGSEPLEEEFVIRE